MQGIKVYSDEVDPPLPRGDNSERGKKNIENKKKLFLQNQRANFNQTQLVTHRLWMKAIQSMFSSNER
jgi:hypothetical protein